MKIYGSFPRAFPVGVPQCFSTLLRVYAKEGAIETVREGEIVVVPEHGDWASEAPEVRHQLPAGATFRLTRAGHPRLLSIIEVLVP